MPNLIQLLGQREKERIAFYNTSQEIEVSSEIHQIILEMLQDEGFKQYVKLDSKKPLNETMVPDCLLAVGLQLLMSYQRIREDNETGAVPQNIEVQESLYYAASAFINMSRTVQVSMMIGK